jgi:transcriptional regulator with XRE-family HTH domain
MTVTNQLAEVKARIKKLRELKGFTQAQLAERLGMTPRNYQNLENGEKDISFAELQIIANALEMSVAGVVGFDEKMVFNNCKVDGNSANYNNYIMNTTEKIYDKILLEKDKYIENLEKQINRQDKQLDEKQRIIDSLLPR